MSEEFYTFTYFRCPFCHAPSWSMELKEESYQPTEDEIEDRKEIPEQIRHETMRCSCGIILNWFSMEKIEETLKNEE